jgi:hypothetical protein
MHEKERQWKKSAKEAQRETKSPPRIRVQEGLHRLLEQAIEQFAPVPRCTSVEPERELVQVVANMLVTDRTLMRPRDPALEKRCHAVNPWQELVGLLLPSSEDRDLELVAESLQAVVALPTVGVDNTARFDGGENEVMESAGGSIRDVPQADAAVTPCSNSRTFPGQR